MTKIQNICDELGWIIEHSRCHEVFYLQIHRHQYSKNVSILQMRLSATVYLAKNMERQMVDSLQKNDQLLSYTSQVALISMEEKKGQL